VHILTETETRLTQFHVFQAVNMSTFFFFLSLSSVILRWWWCRHKSTLCSSVTCKFHCLLQRLSLMHVIHVFGCRVFFSRTDWPVKPSVPVWNQSFLFLSTVYPRHLLCPVLPSCPFSRAFLYPQPGDMGGCCSALLSQLTATELITTVRVACWL